MFGRLIMMHHFHRSGIEKFYRKVRVGKIHSVLAHKLVYEVCTGVEIKDCQEIDHIDNNPSNNRLDNLRVVDTHAENMHNPLTIINIQNWLAQAHNDPDFENNRKLKQRKWLQSEKCKEHMRMIGMKRATPVIGTRLSDGISKYFVSTVEASKYINGCPASVSACCKGKLHTTCGWSFRKV